jgi:hypothetical protein
VGNADDEHVPVVGIAAREKRHVMGFPFVKQKGRRIRNHPAIHHWYGCLFPKMIFGGFGGIDDLSRTLGTQGGHRIESGADGCIRQIRPHASRTFWDVRFT